MQLRKASCQRVWYLTTILACHSRWPHPFALVGHHDSNRRALRCSKALTRPLFTGLLPSRCCTPKRAVQTLSVSWICAKLSVTCSNSLHVDSCLLSTPCLKVCPHKECAGQREGCQFQDCAYHEFFKFVLSTAQAQHAYQPAILSCNLLPDSTSCFVWCAALMR